MLMGAEGVLVGTYHIESEHRGHEVLKHPELQANSRQRTATAH